MKSWKKVSEIPIKSEDLKVHQTSSESHREQFGCEFCSQFYHQTLIVEQCALQIYIRKKQVMTISKLYNKPKDV